MGGGREEGGRGKKADRNDACFPSLIVTPIITLFSLPSSIPASLFGLFSPVFVLLGQLTVTFFLFISISVMACFSSVRSFHYQLPPSLPRSSSCLTVSSFALYQSVSACSSVVVVARFASVCYPTSPPLSPRSSPCLTVSSFPHSSFNHLLLPVLFRVFFFSSSSSPSFSVKLCYFMFHVINMMAFVMMAFARAWMAVPNVVSVIIVIIFIIVVVKVVSVSIIT